MKCEYGICLLCEKQLMDSCPTCSAKRHNGQYTEVEVELTNKNRMRLAVCLECKDKVHLHDKKEIMDAVREGWKREQLRDHWPQEQINRYHDQVKDLAIV